MRSNISISNETVSALLLNWNSHSRTYTNLPLLFSNATFPRRYLLAYGDLTFTHDILSYFSKTRCKCIISGYKRIWCVRSCDHRGTPQLCGVVISLLSKQELQTEGRMKNCGDKSVSGEGVVYEISDDLQEDIQKELDEWEKGGYGRDVLEAEVYCDLKNNEKGYCVKYEDICGECIHKEGLVKSKFQDDIKQKIVSCLCYRVTPSSPSYWTRAHDPYFTSSILSLSSGPSGSNFEYIHNISISISDDPHTFYLNQLSKYYRAKYIYFLFGKGRNKENQLQLNSYEGKHYWEKVTEIIISVDRNPYHCCHNFCNEKPEVVKISMGYSHMAMLFQNDSVYMFGTNEYGQLGTVVSSLLPNIQNVSCGQYHTLYQSHDRAYTSGCNTNGRVSGRQDSIDAYLKLNPLEISDVIDIQAGWCHSIIMTPKKTIIMGQYNAIIESLYREYKIVFDKVFAGYYYTIGIKDNMEVFSMGRNICLGRKSHTRDYTLEFGRVIVELKVAKRQYLDVSVTCGENQVWLLCNSTVTTDVYTWGIVNGNLIQNPVEFKIDKIYRIRELYCKNEELVLIVDGEGKFWECHNSNAFTRVRGSIQFGEKSGDYFLIGMGFGWWMALRS